MTVTPRRDAGDMGRGGQAFQQHWHHRQLSLDDGDTLRWLVIARPGCDPWVALYRSDRLGGLHEDDGFRLLVEHDHPDAALGLRGHSLSSSAT